VFLTNIPPQVYGYNTQWHVSPQNWFITLKDSHTLRLFRNRMPRETLEPKRDKIQEDGKIDIIKQTIY